MKKKKAVIKELKFVIGLCLLIMIVELIYILYNIIFPHTESLYFDGSNKIVEYKNSYIVVGSNNNNDNYYEKAKITRYNKKKEVLFEKIYNVGYNSVYFDTIVNDDSILAIGSCEKNKNDHKDKVRRGLFVKYDFTGTIIFEKDFKLLDNTKFTNIIEYQGYYYIVGQSVYKNTRIGSMTGGAIINKYDSSGNIIWSKSFGDNKTAIFNKMVIVDGYLYVVGGNNYNSGIICKYDFDGNLINNYDYIYTDKSGFSDIKYKDNFFYVVGSYKNDNNYDGLVVKYDESFNMINEVKYSDKENIRFNRLIVDNKDNIVVLGIGTKDKKKQIKSIDNNDYDGIIGKYSLDLSYIDMVKYGDDRDDYFTDIILSNDYYLVTGYSSYEDGSYMSKFIKYSDALKVVEVDS